MKHFTLAISSLLFLGSSHAAPNCTPVNFPKPLDFSPPAETWNVRPHFVDPNRVLYQAKGGGLYFYDVSKKKSTPIVLQDKSEATTVQISPDSKWAVKTSKDRKRITLINLQTGKEQKSITSPEFFSTSFTGDEVDVTLHAFNGNMQTYRNRISIPDFKVTSKTPGIGGTQVLGYDPKLKTTIALVPDAPNTFDSHIEVTGENGHKHIVYAKGVRLNDTVYEDGNLYTSDMISNDPKDGFRFTRVNLAGALEKTITVKSKDGYAYYGDRQLPVKDGWAFDPFTQKKMVPSGAMPVRGVPGEPQSYCTTDGAKSQIFDFTSHRLLKEIQGQGCDAISSYSRTNNIVLSGSRTQETGTYRSICVKTDLLIDLNPQSSCNLQNKGNPAMDALFKKGVCDQPYSDQIMKSLKLDQPKETYSVNETKSYLKALSKPGAFQLERDIHFLSAVLRSKFVQTEPALVQDALAGVLTTDPLAYNTLYGTSDRETANPNHPFMKIPESALKTIPACRTPQEQILIQSRVAEYANSLRRQSHAGLESHLGNSSKFLSQLAPLQSTVLTLPEATRKGLLDDFADQQTEALGPYLNGVFPSKIHKFAENGLNPLFGFPSKSLTDLVLPKDGKQITPLILSSSTIKEGTPLDLFVDPGFKISSQPAIDPANTKQKTYHWTTDQQKYSATVKITPVDGSKIYPQKASPDYKKLWDDQKLTGAIVLGDNMRDNTSVLDQYQNYYQNKGFKKTSETKITNFDQHLLGDIKNGSLDYFVKEAHSDGDEENVFRACKSVIARTYTKKVGDKEETVTLYYPDPNDVSSTYITNTDFGKAMQTRDKNKQGELIYLNTSCWSTTKANNEMLCAKTPKLVDISSSTMASMFSNRGNQPIGVMLNGIREGQTFQQLQDNVNLSSKGSNTDQYVVPGSKQQRAIAQAQGPLYSTVTTIKDQDGKVYHLDAQ